MSTFPPTDEQAAIIAAARQGSNLMVNAMAGCAKTTTLTMMAKAMPLRPSLALAFNVKIKKELESRFPSHFDVMTMNGLGHRAFGKAIGKRLVVEEKKLGNLIKQILKEERVQDSTSDDFVGLIQLVRRAKQWGLIPTTSQAYYNDTLVPDDEDSWEAIGDSLYMDLSDMQIYLARRVLQESINLALNGVIDYDDQIYMSTLFGGHFPKYPVVMVDEAQDLSPINHLQLSKCSLGQLIVVGDPRQAIYAFRGADSASMGSLRKLRQAWTDLPLSTTFRCPKAVVARQQNHAPGFTAAASNDLGFVATYEPGQWQKVFDQEPPQVAILCRNNAPLVKAAMRLIRSGRGCTILGREIEKGLTKLLQDHCQQDDDAISAIAKITAWSEQEVAKARANGKEERVSIIFDKAECVTAVLSFEGVNRVSDATRAIEKMFSSENLRTTLATGHKSKGLEWHTVLHLDPWRIPSKFAKRALEDGDPVPMEQDLNLRYVIETRTQKNLFLCNLEQSQ